MNIYFYDMLNEFMTINHDDLLIYSESKTEHEVHLHWVFDHLYEEILFVKHKKCLFRKDSVEYLGYIIG